MMTRTKVSRRAVLRGMGVGGVAIALPLPWLEGLAGSRARAEDGLVSSPRLIMLYAANGGVDQEWVPSGTGREWVASNALEPLEHLRDEVSILSNLHYLHNNHSTKQWSTGVRNWDSAVSFDQVVAHWRENDAPIRSLVLDVEALNEGEEDAKNFCSFDVDGRPVPPERNPASLFRRMFGSTDEHVDPGHSVLDFVREDAARLRAQLGGADRLRIERHLDAIRDLEVELERTARTCSDPDELEEPGDSREKASQFFRLLGLGLHCDLTRVVNMSFGAGMAGWRLPWAHRRGSDHSAHGWSHWNRISEDDDIGRDVARAILRARVEQLAELLEMLRDTPEGAGTMLDHTLVVWCNEMSAGHRHSVEDVPCVVAGGRAFGHGPGTHIRYDPTPHANLWVTVAQMFGHDMESFGREGRGTLDGLRGG